MARKKYEESIEIPSGVSCTFEDQTLNCKSGEFQISRKINSPGISIKVSDKSISIFSDSANKLDIKKIKTLIAHMKNTFHGLNEKFVYKLESANVHFPMTIKVDGQFLTVTNFLGEKVPRKAKILPNVSVEIKGNEITVSSHDKELAGQTAANFEKLTRLTNKDRRIFQDGIYIKEKPSHIVLEEHQNE